MKLNIPWLTLVELAQSGKHQNGSQKVQGSIPIWGNCLLPPATKLGQGYIFTGMCDSVHRGVHGPGEGCMVLGECLGGAWSRAAWSRGCTGGALSGWGAWSGGCMVPGGLVEKPPPPRRPLLRAVRILLECILVLNLICCMAHMSVIFDLQESTTAKCSRQQRPVCCCLQ